MPKQRKGTAADAVYFGISPWRSTKQDDDHRDLRGEPSESACIVVEEDLLTSTDQQNSNATAIMPQAHPQVDIPYAPPAAQNPPTASAWHTKNTHKSTDEGQLKASIISLVPVDDNLDVGGTTRVQRAVVQGRATLAMIGSERLAGNLYIDINPSSKRKTPGGREKPCGVSGKAVTAYRDCYRDLDWSVVRLEVWGLPGRDVGRPLIALAERTGGDAMRLRSPVQWTAGESVSPEVAALMVGCEEDAHLSFDCDGLLSDAAAAERVKEVMPSFAGLVDIVNEGRMRIEWGSTGP